MAFATELKRRGLTESTASPRPKPAPPRIIRPGQSLFDLLAEPSPPEGWQPPMGLHPQQREAHEVAAGVILARSVGLITGYAGTGKTYLLSELVADAVSRGYRVLVLAPTNKAVRAIEQKLTVSAETMTLARCLGLKKKTDFSTGKVCFVPDLNRPPSISEDVDVVFIDEVSMVSEELLGLLLQATAGRCLLAFGDPRQLPPVDDGKLNSLFDTARNRYELTDVVRHGGAILELATNIRRLPSGRPAVRPATGAIHVCRDQAPWAKQWLAEVEAATSRQDPDYVKALAFENRRADELCALARLHLYGPHADPFVPGEQLITQEPVMDEAGRTLISTSTDLVVCDAIPFEIVLEGDEDLLVEDVAGRPWEYWGLTVLADGEEHRLQVLAHGEDLCRFKKTQNKLAGMAKKEPLDFRRKQLWRTFFTRRDTFHYVQNSAALTIHKSQGSTYQRVFLDLRNVDGAGGWRRWKDPETVNRLAYVGVTRAAQSLHTLGA